MTLNHRREFTRYLAGLSLMLVTCIVPLYSDSIATTERTVTMLVEGVYEIRHSDAPDGFPQGNTTVVIGDRAVLVVDSGLLPDSTRQDVEQIRRWTDKQVVYLVNTHWHMDHTLGNGIYVAAFPSIQIVAQKETQKLISDYNAAALARYPQREEVTKQALVTGKKSDGTVLTEGERKRYEHRLAGVRPTIEALKTAVQFVPNVTFDHELNIDLGHRPVQIRFMGPGNTVGDTIVYLPVEKILAAGDLLDHPVPYFFGDHPVDHVNTLQLMTQLDIQTIVPGHGEILHGKDYIYQVLEFIKEVNTEVKKELIAGARSSEEIELALPKAVDLDKWREKFGGSDPQNRNFFDASVQGLIESAFEQIGSR
jgi:cyclase